VPGKAFRGLPAVAPSFHRFDAPLRRRRDDARASVGEEQDLRRSTPLLVFPFLWAKYGESIL
jgi:hypothetical protein